MLDKIASTILKYNMLVPGERVCVGLSGGADSVSLLFALKELGYKVFAVHVNHNLRGEESKRDENFCRSLCEKQGIELFVESVDVRGYCQENKLSCEEGARTLRYSAIDKHLNGCKLATAHNLNDCFETTLFNLVRGCGVNGLKGIPPVRGEIIRPLIAVTREEIEAYLAARCLEYVTDSTNLQDDCSRNILRLNVVPQLLRINPSLYKTYLKTLNVFEASDEYIRAQADEALEKAESGNCCDFSLIDNAAIRSQAVERLLRKNGIEPSYEKIERLLELLQTGGRINIAKDVYVRAESGRISFETSPKALAPVRTDLKEDVRFGDRRIKFTEISQFDISYYNKYQLKWLIDSDRLAGDAFIRSYSGGEKIRLAGRGFASTVKKLLAGIPLQERKGVAVLADDKGAAWVEGFGADERVCCTKKTVNAVKISVIEI